MTIRNRSQTDSRRDELLGELDRFVKSQLNLLLPVERCWQPSDLLPDMSADDAIDQLQEFRKYAKNIPDDVLVTLVANMITEEALPSYHSWLANLEFGFDPSGVGDTGLASWIRGWVAEEKRHGDVLNRYLFATGRVNLKAIEITIHNLLRNGFDPMTENDAFQGFIYTSFQERATYVAHSGVARLAREHGDLNLAKICDNIAGDEARHERAYERFSAKLFELDPDQSLLAFEAMLKKTIVMPSRRMSDGVDTDLYGLFSAITQRNGIYTTMDYAKIMEHLVRLWDIGNVRPATDAGKLAQDYIAGLPPRYLRLAERTEARLSRPPARPISWIFDRVVN